MKYSKQFIVFLILALSTFCLGQNSTASVIPDSTNLTLGELKQTLGLLTELEYRRNQNVTSLAKENIYKSIIKDHEASEKLYKKEIANFEQALELIKPAWYDNFWTGAAVAAIIISTVFYLAR